MATHEAVAGLGASFELAELGVPAAAELGGGFTLTGGPIQVLELTAALGFSAGFVAQRGDQNLEVVTMLAGNLSEQEGRSVHVQPYRVKGLPASLDALARLMEARAAPGIPLDKSVHPHDPSIIVINRVARFEVDSPSSGDNSRVIVDVTWGNPLASDLNKSGGASGGGVLTLAPSTYSENIWLDRDGNGMQIQYNPPAFFTSRLVTSEVQRQTWTATLTKELATPQYTDMVRAGQINSAVFGVFGPAELLFLGPTINETDEGNYSHGYQFTYNPEGWRLRDTIWVSGQVPIDATVNFNPPTEPGGLGVFEIYDQFDFADLPVFFP